MDANDIVIVGSARTPVGDFLGKLKDVPLVDLSCIAANAALNRANVKPVDVEELGMGCIYKHGNGGNPARQVEIKLGIPATSWAYTIDQQCASGMKALDIVRRSLLTGGCQMGLVVGADVMSRVPYLAMNVREGLRMGDGKLVDGLTQEGLVCNIVKYHMGLTAENLAEEYHITREEQDALAIISHQRACAAINSGKLKDEIVPVEIQTKKGVVVVDRDEHPRADVSMESLGRLKPAFKKEGGTVTAGNASGINDAAAALVVTTAGYAKAHGLKPLAKILSTVSYGVEPRIMGIGPAYAIPKAIKEAGLTEKDIDYYEINEAFAAQFLACNKVLKLDMNKVNANGSGIGLGHPVGFTGVRIVVSAITEMNYRKAKYGVASLCVGGGPAMAAVLERV
ncbi:thiolase family protein [Papillibacter cinnamivorans]|uniref:acetyl-CoA C-acetyltransferase n=1 Tax=Papillibacter cinnamivorans DSM 12816 TaxID=1122930 RepID=A0A1W2BKQ9_9FIRM|nr:thiolase family protein [Papillibacter cinnamivorans]SMC73559.1 acetyl-CoA C-acetyltransferase [Papillibacter cinnamivorans DSM 12816]